MENKKEYFFLSAKVIKMMKNDWMNIQNVSIPNKARPTKLEQVRSGWSLKRRMPFVKSSGDLYIDCEFCVSVTVHWNR